MAQSTIQGASSFSTSWTENSITFRADRAGKFVTLQAMTGGTTKALVANEVLTTVPTGFKPDTLSFVWNASHVTQCAFCVLVNGVVRVGGNQTLDSGQYPRFTITYMTDDDEP